MATRLTYRRKHTYRTRSNHVKRFHTPGGRLSFQYTDKKTSPVVCGETGTPLNGLPVLTKQRWMKLSRKQRSVSRPYGGSLNHEVVRFR
jgi:large subunit ribosomal protein L34e